MSTSCANTPYLGAFAPSWPWEEIPSLLGEQVLVQQRRIGPGNPGLSRLLAARGMLVLVASFYLAGLVFVFLYAIGDDPLSHRIDFSWPFDWLASI
jgi:hypothetical protein